MIGRALNPRLKKLVVITLLVKLAVLGLIGASTFLVPFSFTGHDVNFVYPIGEPAYWASAFKTWDANHYLYLADNWYSPFHIGNAFYPLLPFLIRVAGYLTFGHNLVAGLAVSTLCAVLSVVYLFQLVAKTHDEEVAYRSCLILLAFPTSFYIGLVYTESVFLMLATMLLYYLKENRTAPALACAFLLPLTRPTGILVVVPVLVALVFELRAQGKLDPKKLLVPFGFLAGYGSYLLVMLLATGDAFAGFDAQKVFQASNSLLNLLHPVNWFLSNFIYTEFTLNGFTTSIVNRVFFVVYAVIAALSYRKLDKTQFAYLLITGLVPALTGSLTSYVRYLVIVFPMFVYLALTLRGKTVLFYLVPCSILQVAGVLLHASNRWVA